MWRRGRAGPQHLKGAGCDGDSKRTITPFWTSAVAVTGTTASSGAICAPEIVVGDRAGMTARMLHWRLVCRSLPEPDCSDRRAAWHQGGSELSTKPPSERYLSFAEREEIALLRVKGPSGREIRRRLGRSASTVSRELRRNAATRSGGLEYRASTAQWHAERSARRLKPSKLAPITTLRTYLEQRLADVVTPRVALPFLVPAVPWKGHRHGPRKDRRSAKVGPQSRLPNACRSTSRTTRRCASATKPSIEPSFQERGALRRELSAYLRTGRVLPVPRAHALRRARALLSPEINDQSLPAESADRPVPGHWEQDLILGLAARRLARWLSARHASQRCCIFAGLRGMAKLGA